MTTCPRCGRVAADEIVCAGCGLSLAVALDDAASSAGLMDELGFGPADEASGADTADAAWSDEPRAHRDRRSWWLVGLVAATCVLSVATALLLFSQPGSRHSPAALPSASTAGSAAIGLPPSAPLFATSAGGPVVPGTPTHRRTRTSTRTSSRSATGTATSSVRAGSSRTTTGTTTTGATSAQPSATTSVPRSSATRTTAPPSAQPSVHLAKGGRDPSCGPHCYVLVVTLVNFSGGTHTVACNAQRAGQFATYTTSATTSSNCSYDRMHDTLWVRVDGTYVSNSVSW